ncbi:MAG: hypothetical protein GEU81_02670 [Nitriliruptorales bacterium]|nr:hypothetical protein [Nitriliruptorales bacterium]
MEQAGGGAGGNGATAGLRLGMWAKAGNLVGLVAAIGEDEVMLFDPGQRQIARVAPGELTLLPAGAVTVTVRVDLPLAHGLDEAELRRWVASLTDELLRERAAGALADAGLDGGAALPSVRVDVQAAETSGAVCLCGARTPAPEGAAVPCSACGRQAVAPPQRASNDVLRLGG